MTAAFGAASFIVGTLIFLFRALACTLSLIALVDWWRSRDGAEIPPYNRRRNELAWNWACAGMAIGGVSFIALDFNYRPSGSSGVADLFVAMVWWCWANAITVRFGSRVERPRYLYLATTIFIVGGFAYAAITGAG
ncbi:hypothetical protein [Croceicoccus sp. YJ47]|uniref:hypothetical protein n=1 Tax=Croceicoccus sp. YJ47 TaxID=2798724 RepID=UPI0019229304|nr:hypothetical protein [Croceicoccus sp. YJ47]QQN73883.1 hypothetical protein JD971_14205 [Croceicoccus sp. YJ47]